MPAALLVAAPTQSLPPINRTIRRACAVDMDVSVVGTELAIAEWVKEQGSYPSVLWVSADDLGTAERIVEMAPADSYVRRLRPLVDPAYPRYAWSVGTYRDAGFGSVGA